MNLTKDTYEYILNFADDRDIINMLSVNKKFRDEDFFKRIMERKYPLLIQYKQNETWKNLYLRMVKAIYGLQEKINIPYIPLPNYNPYNFYSNPTDDGTILTLISDILKVKGYYETLEKLLSLYENIYLGDNYEQFRQILNEHLFRIAIVAENIEGIKIMFKKGGLGYRRIFFDAASLGKLEIVKYISSEFLIPIRETFAPETFNDYINKALLLAAPYPEIVKYLTETFK